MGLFSGNREELTHLSIKNTELQATIQSLRQQLATAQERLSTAQTEVETKRMRINQLLDQSDAKRDKIKDLEAWHFFEQHDGHHYIYELRLADGAYYVGESSELRSRLTSHFMGQNPDGNHSAHWPSLHHPQAVIGLIEYDPSHMTITAIRKHETQETLRLMRLYGYQHVRGGIFTAENEDKLRYFLSKPENQKQYQYTLAEIGLTTPADQPAVAEPSATPTTAATPQSPTTVKPVTEPTTEDVTLESILAKFAQPTAKPAAEPAYAESVKSTPAANTDHELQTFLDDDTTHVHMYQTIQQADPSNFVLVTMSDGNDRLIFRRQQRSLARAFHKIQTDAFNVADDSQECHRFGHVQEAILLDTDKYPNGAAVDAFLAVRAKQLAANHYQVFTEQPWTATK